MAGQFFKPDMQWWHHDDKHPKDEEAEPAPEPITEEIPADDDTRSETADPHYHPADEIFYSMGHCDLECKITVFIHILLMMIHLWTNGEQLRGWGRGNLFLLLNTAWFITLFSYNMALASEYPSFLDIPSWKRKVPFGIALITVIYFVIGSLSLTFKIRDGNSITDTN